MRLSMVIGTVLLALSNFAFGAQTIPSEAELKMGYNAANNTCQGRPIDAYYAPQDFSLTVSSNYVDAAGNPASLERRELVVVSGSDRVVLVQMPSSSGTTTYANMALIFNVANVIACIRAGDVGDNSSYAYSMNSDGTKSAVFRNSLHVGAIVTDWSSISFDYANTRSTFSYNVSGPSFTQTTASAQIALTGHWAGSNGIPTSVFAGSHAPPNGFSASLQLLRSSGKVAVFGSDDLALGGIEVLAGSASEARIVGTPNKDVLVGSKGNDWIEGSGGGDEIYGLAGDDVLILGRYRKNNGNIDWRMQNGSESGTITIQTAADKIGGYISGDDGNDIMWGSNGNDVFEGGNGDDRMFGLSGDDKLYGNSGNDWIFGMSGNDVISGAGGNDHTFNNNSSTDGTTN